VPAGLAALEVRVAAAGKVDRVVVKTAVVVVAEVPAETRVAAAVARGATTTEMAARDEPGEPVTPAQALRLVRQTLASIPPKSQGLTSSNR